MDYAGLRPMTLAELHNLNYEPIYIPERLGWYVAYSLSEGLDLYRGGCGYSSFSEYGDTWTAYRFPSDMTPTHKGNTKCTDNSERNANV